MPYHWIKLIHVSTVAFTLSFFALRFYWMIRHPHLVQRPWARRLSQVNDTLLLIAGIALAVMSQQYPPAASWLTAKLTTLVVYILLGVIALRLGRTLAIRVFSGVLALLAGGYMVSVALCRSGAPWQCLGL